MGPSGSRSCQFPFQSYSSIIESEVPSCPRHSSHPADTKRPLPTCSFRLPESHKEISSREGDTLCLPAHAGPTRRCPGRVRDTCQLPHYSNMMDGNTSWFREPFGPLPSSLSSRFTVNIPALPSSYQKGSALPLPPSCPFPEFPEGIKVHYQSQTYSRAFSRIINPASVYHPEALKLLF